MNISVPLRYVPPGMDQFIIGWMQCIDSSEEIIKMSYGDKETVAVEEGVQSSGDPYSFARETFYGGMALGTSFYLADGPQPGPGDAAGAVYQASTIITAGLLFAGTYIYVKLSGTTTSRGTPYDYSWDPEIKRLQNNKLYPPGSKPPKWFWPATGAAGAYRIYKGWPKPNTSPQITLPRDNTYVTPRPIYPYPYGN